RAFGQDLAGRQFAAGEAGRVFDQGVTNQQLREAQAGRLFGQDLANRQLEEGRAGRIAGQDLANRQLGLQGRRFGFDVRRYNEQRPYDELGQLFGLIGQPGLPQFGPTAQYGPQRLDYAGDRWRQYGSQLGNYNARVGEASQLGQLLLQAFGAGGG
ncbi:MAG: hypothetical protein OXH75_22055, partial [Acidobacteria bacterium]|nr:hypothetical protein [Acidobacteriota bacterium]